uniref:Uncharacterized protein n=1 Tax=viral metagenome TaxID=1070528 RepID=A0A6M3M986_9ZZZZ
MACSGAYATVQDYADYWCEEDMDADFQNTVERKLEQAAGPIHMARYSSGGCSCTPTGEASEYLKVLNVVLARVTFNCPCPRAKLTPDERRIWLEWSENQLRMIRTQEIELCSGETGSDVPYVGFAQQAVTEFTAAEIIAKDIEASS